MRRAARPSRLPLARWMLSGRAAVLHIGVRAGLAVLPFPLLRRLLDPLRRPSQSAMDGVRPRPRRIVRAVEAGSRGRWATCLSRALAAQALLGRYGYQARLCIGVRRGSVGGVQAHAWLVDPQGRVLIGDTGDLAGYSQLPSVEGVVP